ncbi:maleylpyruvate isomerase N-terminal domain-containing protein [Streptomyces mirabilis]|uniref:maleylpyruvate isomerase N-terminal domain-containing protein n=1 Tax=Streptomyces mirabilis TaxID=68239 RepID=UPI0033CD566E
MRWRVVEAFRLEAGQLAQAMTEVSAAEWGLPTRCAPWKVSDLLAHVRVVIAWLPGMLAAPASTCAEVSAAEYYRPHDRLAPGINAADRWAAALEKLGWGQLRFLRKATGREPIAREEASDVSRLGVRWLTLG